MKFSSKTWTILLLWVVAALAFFAGCEKSTDGPMDVSDEDFEFNGQGFFLSARLDSGKAIHLLQDTLFLDMGMMWTFSNCALQSIALNASKEDSVLWIAPRLYIRATNEDCPSPYYRPDTTLKILLSSGDAEGVSLIKVKNHADSLLDSIMLRRGNFTRDTFFVYMDSAFAKMDSLPLRTQNTKRGKPVPSILRVLDSLTPRVFYWRTMKATCKHRVDMCKATVADTIYPSRWNVKDTNLVPIHYACADSDSVYCINSKWENDSTSLGNLQERPDTIWHYSTYYTEKIPQCATYNSFAVRNYAVGNRVEFVREMMVPESSEKFCGPSSKKDWMVYNLSTNQRVQNSDTLTIVDDLYKIWNESPVAPDTLIVDSAGSKK